MYINQPLKKYLEEAAAKLPAPGGGSVSALCGALGAAMVSMVANFTVGKEKYKEVESEVSRILSQSEGLRKKLAKLVDADIEAYGKISTAYQMPKDGHEERVLRSRAIQKARQEALEVPLITAEYCYEILKLSSVLVDIGNVHLKSDVGVAAILAEAALRGAVLNVEINLAGIKDANFVKKKREILEPLLKESPVIKNEVVSKVNQSMA